MQKLPKRCVAYPMNTGSYICCTFRAAFFIPKEAFLCLRTQLSEKTYNES